MSTATLSAKLARPLLARARVIRRIRRWVQIAALLVFLYLFVVTSAMTPLPGLANLFYRLDPLVGLTAMLAGRAFIAGLALGGLTLLLTLLFGRAWCSWLCPMGTTLDLLAPSRRARKTLPKPPSERWRRMKVILLVFLLAAALFGNQSFLFFDPITLMTRTLANAVWPALHSAVYAAEAFLYQFDVLWAPLDAVHQTVIYPVFKDAGFVYVLAVPLFLFFAGIVALNWVAERFWCRYLCPLGGLLGLFSRFSLFRREVSAECNRCGACARRCPTGTIDPERNFAGDPAECTGCYDCVESCPREGLDFRWSLPFMNREAVRWSPAVKQGYDPGRREALGTLGIAAVWAALAGVETIQKRQPADLIRPPGAKEASFDALCIRCNECVRICPTQGLQASFLEGGWQSMLTPHLVPRLGYCSYSCNACGQVCPTGAIPNLTLEIKRHTPIGLARVDRTRCLPWVYDIPCIVCEEACPLPNKAVKLEVVQVNNGRGDPITVQRPYVIKELCIGCGVCEYQCPVGGEGAIRAFAYTEVGGYFGDDPNFGKKE